MSGISSQTNALPAGTGAGAGAATQATPAGQGAAAPKQQQAANGDPTVMGIGSWGKLAGSGVGLAGLGTAIYGMRAGRGPLGLAGIAAAVLGGGMAMAGFGADGQKKGREEGVKGLEQAIKPVMVQQQQQIQQYQQVLAQIQQQMQQGAGAGAGTGAGTGSGSPTDPSAAGGQADPSATGANPAAGADLSQYPALQNAPNIAGGGSASPANSAPTAGTAPVIDAAQWTPTALVGQGVNLGVASLPSGGQPVAEQGVFKLDAQIGAASGYTTFDEAQAAARGAIDTTVQNTRQQRWLVVEHGGRYYAMHATLDDKGASPIMPSANANVVGWNAIRFLTNGSVAGQWNAYSWSAHAGSSFSVVGDATFRGPITGGGPTAPGTTTPAVTGGGPTTPGTTGSPAPVTSAQPAAWNPTTLIGTGLAVNAGAVGTTAVQAGYVQLQKLAWPTAFATPADAAQIARQSRSGSLTPSQFERWVTVRGADGHYYLYEGQLVNRAVPQLPGGNAAMHIFGDGFAQYFDGQSWRTQADG